MLDFPQSLIDGTLRKILKRLHYLLEVMLVCVRWYAAYPLSFRNIEEMMTERGVFVEMRQSKYLNNVVEQDHRAVKRITRPMLGFKTFRCAGILLAGIEVMHMIRKAQLADIKDHDSSPANQFYSLAF